jgi:sugar O-acyltransferase (sialic acid O-acetyltransferase NeuD family)
MRKRKIVILGAGGFAREVLDIFEACNKVGQDYDVLGYVVESRYGSTGTVFNDKPILGDFDWLSRYAKEVYAICAVGAPQLRLRLVRFAKERGLRFCSIIHPTAVLTRWVTIGEGVVITAGCVLTNQIHIGNHVHVNLDCTIGHDAVLDDFVTLAPGVHVSGKVALSTGCYIGTGSNIIDNVHIGEWSIVGAGSTIVKDVPANTTVVGVPGRVIKTRNSGWHLKEGA